jgi:siroheme synthase-like protein
MPSLYPAFLKLDGLRVIVVGGGPVAAGKLDGLVAAGARVVLIAPQICDEIRARPDILDARDLVPHASLALHADIAPDARNIAAPLAPPNLAPEIARNLAPPDRAPDTRSAADDPSRAVHALEVPRGAILLVEREFVSPDLDGARWVIAAAPPPVNQQVAAAATARGLFVNAVDDTSAATAYLGGVVRRGDVEIAISTGGAAPALAGLLREAIDALIPDDVARWVDVAKQARLEWKRDRLPMALRRPRLLQVLVELYRAREVHVRFDHSSDTGPGIDPNVRGSS